MFKGAVAFCARIKGEPVTVPLLESNTNEPDVDKVAIESPNGNEILSTTYLASVATREDGIAIETRVNGCSEPHLLFPRDCHREQPKHGRPIFFAEPSSR
jgi:hypothetical protein